MATQDRFGGAVLTLIGVVVYVFFDPFDAAGDADDIAIPRWRGRVPHWPFSRW